MHCAQLGYVPYLRPGALLLTAIVWRHLLNGGTSESRSIEEVYGHIGGRKRNVFGERVKYASSALFGRDMAPMDVLLRHTLFGVYSRALPKRIASLWAMSLIDGQSSRVKGMARPSSSKRFRYITEDLRSCRACINQDIDELGYPSWYVLHTLPPVHHCPMHGDPLVTEIKGSVGGNMWKLRLPTGNAIKSSALRFESASDGYAAYLRLWMDVIEGRLTTIAADAWADYVDRVTERLGGTDNAVGELCEQLTRSWELPTDRLREILGNHLQRDFVRIELEHRTALGQIAQKLVVLTACDALGIAREALPEQMCMLLPSSESSSEVQARKLLLRSAIVDSGFPLAIASGLASGHSKLEIGKSTCVHRHTVQRFIESLPIATLVELSSLGSWAVDSWLPKELLRRQPN